MIIHSFLAYVNYRRVVSNHAQQLREYLMAPSDLVTPVWENTYWVKECLGTMGRYCRTRPRA